MRIVSFAESAVPAGLRAQVFRLQQQAWPDAEPGEPGPVHDPALRPVTMVLLLDGGRAVAALDILSKPIVHCGVRFEASGLSTVVTDRAEQGRGYGHRLVEAAREAIGASGADLGIFTCDGSLRGFYERAGWRCLPGTVLVGGTEDAPFPSDRLDKVTMASFFTGKARAHAPSFVGARIALHPGNIDKLW